MYLKVNEQNKILNKQPFITHYSKLKEIFSLKEFIHYINTQTLILGETFTIINQNNTYRWMRQPWDKFDNVLTSKLVKVMLEEETTIITNANKASNKIIDFINEIQFLVNMATDCHMFYCSKNIVNKGLGRHHDQNDNLMVQIYGKTNVKIWDKKKVIEKTLIPGDLCYVPRLVDHLFESKSKRLSLSFPMAHNTTTNKDYYNHWIKL